MSKLSELKLKWQNLLLDPANKKIRIRDAAKKLAVSESELLATKINDGVQFLLISNFHDFFLSLFDNVKTLMFLIRNDYAVHEKVVQTKYLKLANSSFLNSLEDNLTLLDINFDNFKYCFYESKIHAGRKLCSLQIFDNFGDSVLKIYNKDEDCSAFKSICKSFFTEYNDNLNDIEKNKKYISMNKLNQISRYYLKSDFSLKEKKITGKSSNILRSIINQSSDFQCPIQIHVQGNDCYQYHRGLVENIKIFGPWFNVMDNNFNLHLIDSEIKISKLLEFNINQIKYFSLEFFEKNGNHLIGITSVKNHSKSFLNILHENGILK